ncbi:MAG: speE 2 [Chloroflexi bacterium]|nr:speE 2 [Chloroflexota bacterium]
MPISNHTALASRSVPPTSATARRDLFLISVLILFLELACIRWFPAQVLYLAFFTNTVLLASFLGMSVGCMAASRPRRCLNWTPSLLAFAVVSALIVELFSETLSRALDVGHQASPQLIFFAAEYSAQDAASFVIPIEVVAGFFFVAIALVFVGPGQELGRALTQVPNRVQAYSLNIAGSIVGIVLFAICSWFQLPPLWWFVPIALGLGYLLRERPLSLHVVTRWALLALVALATGQKSGVIIQGDEVREYSWSPYYRIDYDPPRLAISVNLLTHQGMVPLTSPSPAYALPHLLNRDTGRAPFADVLVIGAGSGNDVSRALQWGAAHVDAVEIDPTIYEIGRRDHPDRPYDDPRVTVHLDDGRNFLHTTDRQYDLVVYAVVDSLVLQSSYSSIRLESYLFTKQAFADIRQRLKPDGIFVTYNFFRQGWVVARLDQELKRTFGSDPLVLALPYRERIQPDDSLTGEFDVMFAGDVDRLRRAFELQPRYWLPADRPPNSASPNGFTTPPADVRTSLPTSAPQGPLSGPQEGPQGSWYQFGLASVIYPADGVRSVTDDWPFLYLRQAAIPDLSLRGIAIMGGLALLLIFLFLPRTKGGPRRATLDWRMFFLGAGFMLVETKAVVQMALLFGSTWFVNSVVFFWILVMILLANLFVLRVKPKKLWPYYFGLFVALGLNVAIPLDLFLGTDRWLQVAGSSLLVFAPILFAGVIFAIAFSRSDEPDWAFGANIAGAMVGGLSENVSMVLGFQYLMLLAATFYVLTVLAPRGSALGARLGLRATRS